MSGTPRAEPAAIAANGSAGIRSPSATGENGGEHRAPGDGVHAPRPGRGGQSRSACACSGATPSSESIMRVESSATSGPA